MYAARPKKQGMHLSWAGTDLIPRRWCGIPGSSSRPFAAALTMQSLLFKTPTITPETAEQSQGREARCRTEPRTQAQAPPLRRLQLPRHCPQHLGESVWLLRNLITVKEEFAWRCFTRENRPPEQTAGSMWRNDLYRGVFSSTSANCRSNPGMFGTTSE